MSQIPKELIDEIRSKSDIVETISSYIPLNKKGKNYMALCPFHDDSNPSMSVNQEKQIFKCFVCGAGGNVFTFIQDYEKVHFVEAVIKQAKTVNIDMAQYETTSIKPVNKRKETLVSLMNEVRNFTSYQLKTKEGAVAQDVLHKRGYSDEILAHFGVGVALSNNQIYEFLSAKGYQEEEMLAVDIIRIGSNKIQDVFYNRLMFPISNQYGEVVAFSARTLDPNSTVKYINTGETELYTKSHHLYNLDKVKEKFRHADRIIITEGVTDVFAFKMAGFDETVSTLGVSLSNEQLTLLKRNTKSVVLAFDGDKAGYDATYEIGKKISEAKIPIKIWYNDSGLDPDDLYKKEGAKALSDGLEDALGWYDFLLVYATGLYGNDSFDNKKRMINFFLPLLASEDDLTISFYITKLAQMTQFDEETLKTQLESHKQTVSTHNYPTYVEYEEPTYFPDEAYNETYNYEETAPKIALTQSISRAELEILNQMLLSKEASFIYRRELGYMPSPLAQEASLLIQNFYRTHDILNIADLLSDDISEQMQSFLLEIQDRLVTDKYEKAIMYENIEFLKDRVNLNDSQLTVTKIKQAQNLDEKTKLLDELFKKKSTRR